MMQQRKKDEWRRQALLLPGRSESLTFNPFSYRQVTKIKRTANTTLALQGGARKTGPPSGRPTWA